MTPRRIGILSREFFDPALGRLGGFGFATRRAAETLRDAGHGPVLLAGAALGPDGRDDVDSAGLRVVFGTGHPGRDARRWRSLDLDVLLTIDWHSSFLPTTRALPRTPVLVWSRDPRDADTWCEIATLRLPPPDPAAVASPSSVDAADLRVVGADGTPLEPPGAPTDAGLAVLARRSARWRRPVRHLLTDESLLGPFTDRYGFEPATWRVLGTPVDPPGDDGPATAAATLHASLGDRPYVVFLGRLDPIKRPWVAEHLAGVMPDVDVVVLGRRHLDAGWSPSAGPNLHWMGHVDGAAKPRLLAGAVATLNTSIHETMALSLLESLHHATPLVACLDPGGLVSRFGVAVPEAAGDGLAAVPGLAAAVASLVAAPARRADLGAAGQQWVRGRHAREPFLRTIDELLAEVG